MWGKGGLGNVESQNGVLSHKRLKDIRLMEGNVERQTDRRWHKLTFFPLEASRQEARIA